MQYASGGVTFAKKNGLVIEIATIDSIGTILWVSGF